MKNKVSKFKKLLKLAVVSTCLSGFLLQTYEFLNLYWTYPTVVDIQVSIPSEIDMPAITFCNPNGLKPGQICQQPEFCIDTESFVKANFCLNNGFGRVCNPYLNDQDQIFQVVLYAKYTRHSNFNATTLQLLRKPVQDFLSCTIQSTSDKRNCDLKSGKICEQPEFCIYTENLVKANLSLPMRLEDSLDVTSASYFSDTEIFNFCYTLNSFWMNSDRKAPKIKKSEKIQMAFYINVLDAEYEEELEQFPRYNYPTFPGIQLAVHSPYLSTSPFLIGASFLGGRKYQVKLNQEEKHLLPAPYQTNCTDYISSWKARGGVGPLNQMMVVEECKYNRSLEQFGCVPFSIDYPHNDTVCRDCDECFDFSRITEECSQLLKNYNQPCDFVSYEMNIEEKLVSVEFLYAEIGECRLFGRMSNTSVKDRIFGYISSPVYVDKHRYALVDSSSLVNIHETLVHKRKGYDCDDNSWSRECQTVVVELVFDDLTITNLTYKPKYESIELFSVIGGYLGMYLGVSLVAVYDFAEAIAVAAYKLLQKRQKLSKLKKKMSSR